MIALWAIAVIAALALAPSAFAETQAGWQFNEAARRLDGVAYETLTALVTGVRLALTGLMLATAALLLTRRAPGAGLAALALTTLPFTFNLAGSGVASGYPSLLAGLLRAVALALGLVGIVALLLLLFLFPDGRVYPPRLRRPVLAARGEDGTVLRHGEGGTAPIHMDGPRVYQHAVREMLRMLDRACREEGLTVADLDLVVPHQANARIIEAVRARSGLGPERFLVNVDRWGNTSSSTIPLALAELAAGDPGRAGHLGLVAFGAGFTSAAAILDLTGGRESPEGPLVP